MFCKSFGNKLGNFYTIGQIYTVEMAKDWINNLAIWSHCSGVLCTSLKWSNLLNTKWLSSVKKFWPIETVWPEVEIKSSPSFSKSCPKSSNSCFYWRIMLSTVAQKVIINFSYSLKNTFQKLPNLVTLNQNLSNSATKMLYCKRHSIRESEVTTNLTAN